jgi:hypothetical protein
MLAMRRPGHIVCAIAVVVLLVGCGESVDRREIALRSPVLQAKGIIPAGYSCTSSMWLPLRWSELPAGTDEAILYMGGFGLPHVRAKGRSFSLVIARSLITGLRPGLRGLTIGGFPDGTHVVTEAGKSLCPPETSGREFVFRLYALPHKRRINASVLNSSELSRLVGQISGEASAEGVLAAAYGQR